MKIQWLTGWNLFFATTGVGCIVLLTYWREYESQLVKLSMIDNILKFEVKHDDRLSVCLNILQNLTVGKWVRKEEYMNISFQPLFMKERVSLEDKVESHLVQFRTKWGIYTERWGHDDKCGYTNLQRSNSKKLYRASWCDHRSDKPCCSNDQNGVCGTMCDCPECVDMRKILHAEIAEWIPKDVRCKRRNYTAEEACDTLKSFSGLHFIGDSFTRKMARALILTLRADPVYGALLRRYSDEEKAFCVGYDGMYWKKCNIFNGFVRDQLVNNGTFCPDNPITISYYAPHLPLITSRVSEIANEPGSVVFIGLGLNKALNVTSTSEFLEPVLKLLQSQHVNSSTKRVRPHIVFMYPDMPGLIKPVRYLTTQGRKSCEKFSEEMKIFCDKHDVPILDFRNLTTGVHSYDGTHHGLGVNLMKVQIMLNYLDSLEANTR